LDFVSYPEQGTRNKLQPVIERRTSSSY